MKILFLGDVVGISGRSMVLNNLLSKIKDEKIDFVVVNGEKYQVVGDLVKQVNAIKDNKTKIDDQEISDVLTVNGIRFSFKDGSWGLIRASSNKPSLKENLIPLTVRTSLIS